MSDSEDTDDEQLKQYISSSSDLKKHGWGASKSQEKRTILDTEDNLSLRQYQVDGVNWIIDRYEIGHGCILGDEMGLGKTCQTIAVITYIHAKAESNVPSLVVCPRSVLENWEQEVNRFAPGLKTQVYIGEKEARHELADNIKKDNKKGTLKFDVLITTYEMCIKDSKFIQRLKWNLLVIDEAHRIKNLESALYKTLTEVDFRMPILLTGTPIQNNLKELYALLSFVIPVKFPPDDHDDFVEKYSKVNKSEANLMSTNKIGAGGETRKSFFASLATTLHRILQPLLLVRTKAVTLKDLPGKSEIVLTHGISKLQTKLYKGILVKDFDVFGTAGDGSGSKQSTRLMNILMQLRKCVNHPYLFDGVEPEPFVLGEHLVEASGKLVLIDKLLKYLKANGHKVLMFSQMTHMLDVLQDYMGYRGYNYERLDGSVRGEERFLAIQNFNQSEETFVFLLSTRAGGQGINLTSADTVIFVDSDFNPQNDLQAAARAHRIGQTRPVKIIRLIGKNTVEEIVLNRAEEKLKLTSAVIKEGQFSLGASKQGLITDDKVKLQDILQYGVDELFKDKESDEVDIDFSDILGPTVGGEWQPEEKDKEQEEEKMEEEAEGEVEESPQSMYVFEGKDYSNEPSADDKKAFEELVEAEKAVLESKLGDARPLRTKRASTVFMMGLPDVLRKPRKKLTDEEKEERRKKAKAAAEKRAKEAEEQEMRRAQELRKRRDELWKKNNYESLNIPESDGEDGSDDEEDEVIDDDDGSATSRDIQYVIGDVTHPKQTERETNIIIHCADCNLADETFLACKELNKTLLESLSVVCVGSDDSGSWGRGGLFTAISSRSMNVENHYTLAGKMQDLALGDCHLIPIDDGKSEKGEDFLGLIIAQHRDQRNHLSGIKLSALRYGLEKVYKAASQKKASVHLPRIGHDTKGFNWYGTEKLIKKNLASKGIPTYLYYFPRKHHQKRKMAAGPSHAPPPKVKKVAFDVPSTSGTGGKVVAELLDIFTSSVIYVHKDGLSDSDYKKYKRYIIAYDGDFEAIVTERTTQIVMPKDCDAKTISELSDENPSAAMVTTEWLDDCLTRRKFLKTVNYEIT